MQNEIGAFCWEYVESVIFNSDEDKCIKSILCIYLVCITLCPSSFAVILTRKRELVSLLLLSFGCLVTVNVLWIFFTVTWVGLQFAIVVFSDHTH